MSFPTVVFEAAFGKGPLDLLVDADYTALTADVRSISIRRGRSHELQRTEAGTGQAVLSNRQRKYDPSNAAGPYAGNLVPMTPIRVKATLGTTYNLFTGFVEDWGQSWGGRPIASQGDAETTVQAVDAFKLLSLHQVASFPTEVLADSPVGYYRLNEAAGSATVVDASNVMLPLTVAPIAATLGVSPGPLASTSTVIDILGVNAIAPLSSSDLSDLSVRLTPADVFWTAGFDVTIEAWIRPDSVAAGGIVGLSESLNSQVRFALSFAGAGALTLAWTSSGTTVSVTSIAGIVTTAAWQFISVVRTGTRIDWYVNGVLVDTSIAPQASSDVRSGATFVTYVVGNTSTTAQSMDGRLAHVLTYPRALSAVRIAAHYAARVEQIASSDAGTQINQLLDAMGWPATKRQIGVGSAQMAELSPSGSVLDMCIALAEDSEQGLFQVTGSGDLLFHSRDDLIAQHATSLAIFGDGLGGGGAVYGTAHFGTDTYGTAGTVEIPYQDLELRDDDQDLYTIVVATNEGGADQRRADTVAAERYGPRVLPKSGLKFSTDQQAADLAGFLLSRYSKPRMRPVQMVMAPGENAAIFAQVLPRNIHADHVTVKRRPPGGGSPISLEAQIEGVTHDISPPRNWRTVFDLVPAASSQVWILGVNQLDVDAVVSW